MGKGIEEYFHYRIMQRYLPEGETTHVASFLRQDDAAIAAAELAVHDPESIYQVYEHGRVHRQVFTTDDGTRVGGNIA